MRLYVEPVPHTFVPRVGLEPKTGRSIGARNLIFILLQLLEFFKSFQAKVSAAGVHLVFIEEPEAHLHPQMAEVFIRKLEEIKTLFSTKYNNGVPWPVQFVVSTHSSHLANEAHFESIRYFLATSERQANTFRETRIKDLRDGLKGTSKPDKEFLHQYMTLTRCDLFFADKAVLIEGCTERILLPAMINKCDAKDGTSLSSQYVSVVEICGAYAHRFFDLLEFLELRTLIITDLDSAKKVKKEKTTVLEGCLVAEGTHTTNGCIKGWFQSPDVSVVELIGKKDEDKRADLLRLAYEIPEVDGGPCGRSFEDAFMLANLGLFELDRKPAGERATAAYELASGQKKSEFALKYALEKPNWDVPTYIRKGLKWLATTPTVSSNAFVACDEAAPLT